MMTGRTSTGQSRYWTRGHGDQDSEYLFFYIFLFSSFLFISSPLPCSSLFLFSQFSFEYSKIFFDEFYGEGFEVHPGARMERPATDQPYAGTFSSFVPFVPFVHFVPFVPFVYLLFFISLYSLFCRYSVEWKGKHQWQCPRRQQQLSKGVPGRSQHSCLLGIYWPRLSLYPLFLFYSLLFCSF